MFSLRGFHRVVLAAINVKYLIFRGVICFFILLQIV